MALYRVRPGDTLTAIAKDTGTSVDELVKTNNIADPNKINIGQTLVLGATTAANTVVNNKNNASTGQNNTPVAAPTLKPLPTTPTYDSTSWDDTEKGKGALDAYNSYLEALKNYGDFTYSSQQQYDDLKQSILNRDKFSYDLNSDALYQQYKDKYIQQGKLAMGDAIGQASAMTGGYGNSYAQSVGQQAYQAQLDNLNDMVPEFYQMALDKYNMEGQDLYDQYAMLGDQEELDYGRYRDEMSDWLTERDYLAGRYDSEREYDYSKFADNRDFDYDAYRDSVADDHWQKEYDLATSEVVDTTDNSTGHTGIDKDSVATPTGYNPKSSITPNDIKQMQAAIGVDQDGKWGPQSTAAAGGLTVEEAYKAWKNGTLKKVETKTWKDFSNEELEKNWEENGGSYYTSVLNDLKSMKASGKSNAEANAYLKELIGNSLISQSEYQTLYNKYRDNNLK